MSKQPVFVTMTMKKGGVGKTDLAFNFINWLAIEKDKKVLAIDLDENCNLSQVMDVYNTEHSNDTVANILYDTDDVTIHHIRENIDLIAGHNRLQDVQDDIATSEKKTMMLYLWLEDNYERLNIGQYDFVVMDTHNDFGTATKNAIAVSHIIFSPITPNDFSDEISFTARLEEFRNEVIDYRTRESYITAEHKLIGNMVRINTKNGKDFLKKIESNDKYVAYFPFLDVFNKSIQKKRSISELLTDTDTPYAQRQYKEDYDKNMEKIYMEVKKFQ